MKNTVNTMPNSTIAYEDCDILSVISEGFDIHLKILSTVSGVLEEEQCNMFTIICRSCLDTTVSVGPAGPIRFLDCHPVLEFLFAPSASLYIKRPLQEVERALGIIYRITQEYFEGWIEADRLLNSLVDLDEVFLNSGNLLVGPLAYVERICSSLSSFAETYLVPLNGLNRQMEMKILVVGETYVVCKAIEIIRNG